MVITLLAPLKSSRTSRRRALTPQTRPANRPKAGPSREQRVLLRAPARILFRRRRASLGCHGATPSANASPAQVKDQRMRDGVLNVSHSRALAREHLVPRIGPFHDLRMPAWAFATALLQSRRSGHCIRGRCGSRRRPLHRGRMDVARGFLIGRSSAAGRARKGGPNADQALNPALPLDLEHRRLVNASDAV
jgi:hypothetical protein